VHNLFKDIISKVAITQQEHNPRNSHTGLKLDCKKKSGVRTFAITKLETFPKKLNPYLENYLNEPVHKH